MVAKNPVGYPLSAESVELEDGDFVIYRPRIKGRKRRPRVKLPEILARAFEAAAGNTVEERQALRHAGEPDAWRAPAKRAKKKAAKKKAAKKTAKKRARKTAPPTAEAREEPSGQRRLFNPSRGPALDDLGTLTGLADVRELLVELPDGRDQQYRWTTRRPQLLWSPRQRALLWVDGARPHTTHNLVEDDDDGAARLFEAWQQSPPRRTQKMIIPAVRLRPIGYAVQIVYGSNKWGHRSKRTYEHDHSGRVLVYQGAKGVIAIHGGRLTVNERGIVY